MNNERKQTILDDKKFALYGKFDAQAKGRPKLFFQVSEFGNVAILVFPNDPADQEKRPIRAAMDPYSWGAFLAACREVLASPEAKELRIANYTGAPNKKFVDSTTVIGKSDDGAMYLAVIKEGRASKRFIVGPDEYHTFTDRQGTEIDRPTLSRLFAGGFFNQLELYVGKLTTERWAPAPQRDKNGGGGFGSNRGGGNNAGGSNRGGNSSSGGGDGFDGFDDDIPV